MASVVNQINVPGLHRLELGKLFRKDELSEGQRSEIEKYDVKTLDGMLDRYGKTDRMNYSNEVPLRHVESTVVHLRPPGRILLLQRSEKVSTDKLKWSLIDELIDTPRISVGEFALVGIKEELGWDTRGLRKPIENPNIYVYGDERFIWVVHPVLVRVNKKPIIVLNDENLHYRWLTPKLVANYARTPRCNTKLIAATIGAGVDLDI